MRTTTPPPTTAPAHPVVAYRMRNAIGACSLHHERPRAEQAAVDHRGTVTELVELTPDLRALIAAQPAAQPAVNTATPPTTTPTE